MDESILIKNMTKETLQQGRVVLFNSWLDTYPNEEFGISRSFIEGFVAQKLSESESKKVYDAWPTFNQGVDGLSLVAITGQTVIGICYSSKLSGQTLKTLYVDKNYHGLGVGQALLSTALNWFDADKDVNLYVVDYNERAKAFYKKNGFYEAGPAEGLFARKMPEVQMIRPGNKT